MDKWIIFGLVGLVAYWFYRQRSQTPVVALTSATAGQTQAAGPGATSPTVPTRSIQPITGGFQLDLGPHSVQLL